jgi:hypothetical protein
MRRTVAKTAAVGEGSSDVCMSFREVARGRRRSSPLQRGRPCGNEASVRPGRSRRANDRRAEYLPELPRSRCLHVRAIRRVERRCLFRGLTLAHRLLPRGVAQQVHESVVSGGAPQGTREAFSHESLQFSCANNGSRNSLLEDLPRIRQKSGNELLGARDPKVTPARDGKKRRAPTERTRAALCRARRRRSISTDGSSSGSARTRRPCLALEARAPLA